MDHSKSILKKKAITFLITLIKSVESEKIRTLLLGVQSVQHFLNAAFLEYKLSGKDKGVDLIEHENMLL